MSNSNNNSTSAQQFRRSIHLLTAITLVGIMLMSGALTRAENPTEDFQIQNGLLVLTNGSVAEGRISVVPGGYLLETPTGQVSVPFSTVICFAKSLKEAYRKQRESMIHPTADLHATLGQWCMTNRLFEEAELEIEAALRLQPSHAAALRLLEKFDKSRKKRMDFSEKEKKELVEDLIIKREFSNARPIGDLEESLAREYVVAIEPLLLNRCSNAGCHSKVEANDFRLQRTWNVKGNTRYLSDQNLESVLQFISPHNPSESPILTVLDGKHGLRGRSVFVGAKADQQRKSLELWVYRVAAELAKQSTAPKKLEPSDVMIPNEIMQVGYETQTDSSKSVLYRSRQDMLPDPFDPEIFNKRVHGRKKQAE